MEPSPAPSPVPTAAPSGPTLPPTGVPTPSPTSETVVFTFPSKLGQSLQVGRTYNITWMYTGGFTVSEPETVNVELHLDGSKVASLAVLMQDRGYLEWTPDLTAVEGLVLSKAGYTLKLQTLTYWFQAQSVAFGLSETLAPSPVPTPQPSVSRLPTALPTISPLPSPLPTFLPSPQPTLTPTSSQLVVMAPVEGTITLPGQNLVVRWAYTGAFHGDYVPVDVYLYADTVFVANLAAAQFSATGEFLASLPTSLNPSAEYRLRIVDFDHGVDAFSPVFEVSTSWAPTSVPTYLPTPRPSSLPVPSPTSPPSAVPMPIPSGTPTAFPSFRPTATPTSAPTGPSSAPSGVPTPVPTASALIITRPMGGPVLGVNTTFRIQYAFTGSYKDNAEANGDQITILLYKDGAQVQAIASLVDATGSYNWPVSAGLVLGSGYRLRIRSIGTFQDVYSDEFSIDGTPEPSAVPSPVPTTSPWPTPFPSPAPTTSPVPTPQPSVTPFPTPQPSPKPSHMSVDMLQCDVVFAIRGCSGDNWSTCGSANVYASALAQAVPLVNIDSVVNASLGPVPERGDRYSNSSQALVSLTLHLAPRFTGHTSFDALFHDTVAELNSAVRNDTFEVAIRRSSTSSSSSSSSHGIYENVTVIRRDFQGPKNYTIILVPGPTPLPTFYPTPLPVPAPTLQPSPRPTSGPTLAPSSTPSPLPTPAPTAAPMAALLVLHDGTNIGSGTAASLSANIATLSETGADFEDLTVSLSGRPRGIVTVTIGDRGGHHFDARPASVTFTPYNYSTSVAIRVRARRDYVDLGDTFSSVLWINASAADVCTYPVCAQTVPYDGLATAVGFSIGDVDTAGLKLVGFSNLSAIVNNFGDSSIAAVYRISLRSKPRVGSVTIAVSTGSPSFSQASPASVTFDATNWNESRAVSIVATAATSERPACGSTNYTLRCPALTDRTDEVLNSVVNAATSDTTYHGMSRAGAVSVVVEYDSQLPPTLLRAQFLDALSGLELEFDTATNRAGKLGTFDCDTMLNSSYTGRAALGTSTEFQMSGAACAFVDTSTVRVTFGSEPTVTVGDFLMLRPGFLQVPSSDQAPRVSLFNVREVVGVSAPRNPVTPVAELAAPEQLGVCADLTLDAGLTTGSGGRPMAFNFTLEAAAAASISGTPVPLSSLGNVTRALARAASTNPAASQVTIPSDAMEAGVRYTFRVTAQNFLGQRSAATSTVTKSTLALPGLQISGPSVKTTTVSSNLMLKVGEVDLPVTSCDKAGEGTATVSAHMDFEWRETSGNLPASYYAAPTPAPPSSSPFVLAQTTTSARSYLLDTSRLDPGATYTFEVVATMSQHAYLNTTASTIVKVEAQDLVCSIDGGDRTVGSAENLTLAGSSSYDPDNATGSIEAVWSCTDTATRGACAAGLGTEFSTGAFVTDVPSGTLAPGEYEFTLECFKDHRNSTASMVVTVEAGSRPTVTLTQSRDGEAVATTGGRRRFNPGGFLQIDASWASPALEVSVVSAQWSLGNDGEGSADVSGIVQGRSTVGMLGGLSRTLTTFSLGKLAPGGVYSLRLTVADSLGASAQASLSVEVNEPPSSGSLTVSPVSGTGLDTEFTLRAENWVDSEAEDYPLRFLFGARTGTASGDQGTSNMALGDASESAALVDVLLPPGDAQANYAVTSSVTAMDAWGAESVPATVEIQVNAPVLTVSQLMRVSLLLVRDSLRAQDSEGAIRAVRVTAASLPSAMAGARRLASYSASVTNSSSALRAELLDQLWNAYDVSDLTLGTAAMVLGSLDGIIEATDDLIPSTQASALHFLKTLTTDLVVDGLGTSADVRTSVASCLESCFHFDVANASHIAHDPKFGRNVSDVVLRLGQAMLQGTYPGVSQVAVDSNGGGGFQARSLREEVEFLAGEAIAAPGLAATWEMPRNASVLGATGRNLDLHLAAVGVNLIGDAVGLLTPFALGAITDSDTADATTIDVGVLAVENPVAYTLTGLSHDFLTSGINASFLGACLDTDPASAQVLTFNCPLGPETHTCDPTLAPYSVDYTCGRQVPECVYGDLLAETVWATERCSVVNHTATNVTCQCTVVPRALGARVKTIAPVYTISASSFPSPAPTTAAPTATFAPTATDFTYVTITDIQTPNVSHWVQMLPRRRLRNSARSTIVDPECFPSLYAGAWVNTSGVVSILAADGFYLASANASSTGGLFSGIFVAANTSARAGVYEGSTVWVLGEVAERDGTTIIHRLRGVSVDPSVGLVSVPATPLQSAVVGGDCTLESEAYEGMLVALRNVTVSVDHTTGGISGDDGSGAASIRDFILDTAQSLLAVFGYSIDGEVAVRFQGTVENAGGECRVVLGSSADLEGFTPMPTPVPTPFTTPPCDGFVSQLMFWLSVGLSFLGGLVVPHMVRGVDKALDLHRARKTRRVMDESTVASTPQQRGLNKVFPDPVSGGGKENSLRGAERTEGSGPHGALDERDDPTEVLTSKGTSVDALTGEIADLKDQIDAFVHQVADLKERNTTLDSDVMRLRREVLESQSRRTKAERATNRVTLEVKRLERQKKEVDIEAKHRLSTLEVKVKSALARAEAAELQYNVMHTSLMLSKSVQEKLKQEKQESDDRADKLERVIEMLKATQGGSGSGGGGGGFQSAQLQALQHDEEELEAEIETERHAAERRQSELNVAMKKLDLTLSKVEETDRATAVLTTRLERDEAVILEDANAVMDAVAVKKATADVADAIGHLHDTESSTVRLERELQQISNELEHADSNEGPVPPATTASSSVGAGGVEPREGVSATAPPPPGAVPTTARPTTTSAALRRRDLDVSEFDLDDDLRGVGDEGEDEDEADIIAL